MDAAAKLLNRDRGTLGTGAYDRVQAAVSLINSA
jgi:hypothetical protein